MQIKVGATFYPFPTRQLELGEHRLLKREFGVVLGRDEFDPYDPDHMGAVLFSAMREADPDAPASALISRINHVREIEIVGDDGKPVTDGHAGVDPTPPPPSGESTGEGTASS